MMILRTKPTPFCAKNLQSLDYSNKVLQVFLSSIVGKLSKRHRIKSLMPNFPYKTIYFLACSQTSKTYKKTYRMFLM